MAGSISIDTAALEAAISELQALQGSTALSDALQGVAAVAPTQSIGSAANEAKGYYADLKTINSSFANLITQTIAILSNAEEYFTMTDEELAAYIAARA